jgi:ABC-type branched-subunit amino acid transport system ATPase component
MRAKGVCTSFAPVLQRMLDARARALSTARENTLAFARAVAHARRSLAMHGPRGIS